MSRNWITPTDFKTAVVNGKWNGDIILRLYRNKNPLISRAEAIEAFKSLKLTKEYTQPYTVDAHPLDFSSAVDKGAWRWNYIYYMYEDLGETNRDKIKAHFLSLGISPERPFLYYHTIPANLFISDVYGTIYLPNLPYPETMPEDIFERADEEPTRWFKFLVGKLGYKKAYLSIAYNMKRYFKK